MTVLLHLNPTVGCTFEADEDNFSPEPPVVIDGTSAVCDKDRECRSGIIRGCDSVVCSGVNSCARTKILDVPTGGTVTCSGPNSCDSATIEAASGASDITVNCTGDDCGSTIRGAKTILCSGVLSCSNMSILDVQDGGLVSCSESSSCGRSTIAPVPGASITIDCTGEDACQFAEGLDAGETGSINCSGNCGHSDILKAKTVSCPNTGSCGGVKFNAMLDGNSVICSGLLSCYISNLKAVEGAAADIECSGERSCEDSNIELKANSNVICSGSESCSEAIIDVRPSGNIVCSGPDACVGEYRDLFIYVDHAFTRLGSKCLVCETGSCTPLCYFYTATDQFDCADGQENGDCEGFEVPGPISDEPPSSSSSSPLGFIKDIFETLIFCC